MIHASTNADSFSTTYRTFGCEDSQPTFRYSLVEGVNDGYLIRPTVIDARTEITTELLSDQGFTVQFKDEEGEGKTETFKQREFEKRFFAQATNELFCKTFLEHAPGSDQSGDREVHHFRSQPALRLETDSNPERHGG